MPITHPALRPIKSNGSATYILDYMVQSNAMLDYDTIKDRKPALLLKEAGAFIAELSTVKRDNKDQVTKFVTMVLSKDFTKYPADYRDAIGFFLVEVMRLCNLTFHEPSYLKKFKAQFDSLKIEWKGQPDECISNATFAGLAYIETDGGYVQTTIK